MCLELHFLSFKSDKMLTFHFFLWPHWKDFSSLPVYLIPIQEMTGMVNSQDRKAQTVIKKHLQTFYSFITLLKCVYIAGYQSLDAVSAYTLDE